MVMSEIFAHNATVVGMIAGMILYVLWMLFASATKGKEEHVVKYFDYGDGSPKTTNIYHNYKKPGEYNIKVTEVKESEPPDFFMLYNMSWFFMLAALFIIFGLSLVLMGTLSAMEQGWWTT